jgi:RNA polymerase sigma-70 factor (ECF subfamily)
LDDVIVTLMDRSPAARDEGTVADRVRAPAEDRLLAMLDQGLDRAFRLAGLILGSQTEAEDATQEALVSAWRSAGSLRNLDGFGAWFDRILINACRDRMRRRGRVRLIALEDAGSSLVARDPFRAVADRDEVLRAMANLSDDERIVVLLHYWDDLTLEAVAGRVGWPVGTVKSRLHRALQSMRSAIGSGDPGAER